MRIDLGGFCVSRLEVSGPSQAYFITDGFDESVYLPGGLPGATAQTFAGWFYFADWSVIPATRVVGWRLGDSISATISLNTGSTLYFGAYSATQARRLTGPAIIGASALPSGFHHIGLVVDSAGVTGYVDGVNQGTGTTSVSGDISAGLAVGVGGSAFYQLDGVRGLFRSGTKFTDSQMAALAALGYEADPTNEILAIDANAHIWPVTSDDGPAAIGESSGNGSDGVPSNLQESDFFVL